MDLNYKIILAQCTNSVRFGLWMDDRYTVNERIMSNLLLKSNSDYLITRVFSFLIPISSGLHALKFEPISGYINFMA